MKGEIKARLVVDCGICLNVYELFSETKGEAATEARNAGWSHIGKHGWVCPDCKSDK